MHFVNGSFWGMHLFWWLFWLLFVSSFFTVLTPVPRHKARETPLQILQRRYATGEISTEEYEHRKQRLERDTSPAKN